MDTNGFAISFKILFKSVANLKNKTLLNKFLQNSLISVIYNSDYKTYIKKFN